MDNQDVCELLHISKRTLQHYRDSGKLPFSQIGAKIYYKASDIDAFLQSNYSK
jgi:excisionase family DNA binding protein